MSGKKTCVYLCACNTNIAEAIDLDAVAKAVGGADGVAYVRQHKLLCSEEGKNFLLEDLKSSKPDRIVIAACSPKEHEHTFMKVCEKAHFNPYLFQMVNIREQVAWVITDKSVATKKAICYIRGAVGRVAFQEPLERKEIDCNTDALVIGAGPAGMDAAVLLAKSGRKVYLVEKSPCIGGKAVRFEDVFPRLECAPCMLEPKMDEVLHDENIELIRCAEVEEVLGFMGNFVVKVRKNAAYVDKEKCIGCAACYEPCPVKVKNEFDGGLSERHAIYVPFAGALPNVPVIDKANCLRFKGKECTICEQNCPFGALNYADKDEVLELKVGGIVVAVGYDLYDVSALPELGYGKIPEVYTAMEFERLLASNGPTSGKLVTKDGREPKSVAVVHCAGSMDVKHKDYCSEVCCLYSLKFAHLAAKKLPGIKVHGLFGEWCVPGKENRAFLDHTVHAEGIEYKRMKLPVSANVKVAQKGPSIEVKFKDDAGKDASLVADMVVLCPPVVPAKGSDKLANMLQIARDKDGFFAELHSKLASVSSNIDGIYIAGAAQGPKDIQRSTAQGSAASAQIMSALVKGRKLELEPVVAESMDTLCSGCKICISMCPYKAISFDEEKKVTKISEVLCKGCGTCVATCPSGAIKGRNFTNKQIFAELEGLLQ